MSGRIRIRSGGLTHETWIVAVAEDGTETPLEGVVRSCTWRCGSDGDGFATAEIEFEQVEIDAIGATEPGS